MDFNSIGLNLRKVRHQRGMRQEDLAEASGISLTYYGALERGEKIPSLETFIAILNALNVSADVILCDVVNAGYEVKHSLISEKLNGVCKKDREKIYDVIDTMIKHASKI